MLAGVIYSGKQGRMNNKTIIIVGGGTAGWMVAAALSRFLEHGYNIQLVESDELGTIGVGEATIPQIQLFNKALGIDENEFMRATNGSFKLGIQFVDWLRPGHSYMHAFGTIGRDLGLIPFHQYWLRARALGSNASLDAYTLSGSAAFANKFMRGAPTVNAPMGAAAYAFHFDAGLYAQYLRRIAEARGVVRTEGKITSVALAPLTGYVENVSLEHGLTLQGDIFIDCSGFRGLLIEEALHTGYDDWSKWLPCDRALAVPCAPAPVLTPYTRSTAQSAGWQWRIPLQHRTGNGHVYCSAYTSDDAAANTLMKNLDGKALTNPRPLKFVTGKRKKIWNKNVIAMGLAAGFLEPLESTSIHLIQSAIQRFINFIPGINISSIDVEVFNAQIDFEYERVRDFIILHYKANQRDDPFWRACREMPIPQALTDKIELFKTNGRIVRFNEELFAEAGWLQVMSGQGIEPQNYHPLADQPSEEDLLGFLSAIRLAVSQGVHAMPSHAEYITEHCRATGHYA